METRKLCKVCYYLNLKPDTFLQTGWRYPTSLQYESLTELLDASNGGTVPPNSHYVPGEKLEDVLWLSDDVRNLNQDTDSLPSVTHLDADELTKHLNTKLPAPLLRHTFNKEGDPEWTVPVKSGKLGLLREVSRRATDGCSLCQLVVRAAQHMATDATYTGEIADDSMCKIRFDFRDIKAQSKGDTTPGMLVNIHEPPLTPEISVKSDLINETQRSGYYECSIVCSSASIAVSPFFPANGDFAWFGGRQIQPIANYLLAKQWLSSCDMSHPKCSHEYDDLDLKSVGRLRVIDVEQSCLIDIVVPGPKFLTLSYVWGNVPTLKLNEHNLKVLQQPGALTEHLAQIPETIRDTFHVARQLGLQYVWVDSLCVLQTDSTEITPELRKMDLIYAAAYLTVVATDGFDAGVGLPGSTAKRLRDVSQLSEYDDKLGLMLDLRPIHTVLNSCPWSQRLWTLQEALMSRRLLLFTEHGLHFTCGSLCWSENLKDVGETTSPAWNLVRENVYFFRSYITDKSFAYPRLKSDLWDLELWLTTVMDASERSLKYEWDVENATAGLMTQLEMCYNTTNCYGLPEVALAESLLWGPLKTGCLSRRRSKPGGNIYPTWTWMGWVGEVSWPGGYVQDAENPTEAFIFEILKSSAIDKAPTTLNLLEADGLRSRRDTYRYLHLHTRKIVFHVQRHTKALQHIQELQVYVWSVVPSSGEAKKGVHVVSTLTGTGSYKQVGSVFFDSEDSYPGEDDFDCLFVQIGSKPQAVDVGDYAGQLFLNVLAVKQIRVLEGGQVLVERTGHGRILLEETRGMWNATKMILQ